MTVVRTYAHLLLTWAHTHAESSRTDARNNRERERKRNGGGGSNREQAYIYKKKKESQRMHLSERRKATHVVKGWKVFC